MRLLKIESKLFIARNILNLEEIDQFLKKIWHDNLGLISDADMLSVVAQWLKTKLKSYIFNDYEGTGLISFKGEDAIKKLVEFNPRLYPWLEKLIQENRELPDVVYRFSEGNDVRLRRELTYIFEYFESLRDSSKIKSMTYQDALKNAIKYKEQKEKKERLEVLNDLEFIMNAGDGYKWYQVTSENSCVLLGNMLQNCIKDYTQENLRWVHLYVLMDKDREAHVAIEVGDGILKQLKGKQNAAPDDKYTKYIKEMFQADILNINKWGEEKTFPSRYGVFVNRGSEILDLDNLETESVYFSEGTRGRIQIDIDPLYIDKLSKANMWEIPSGRFGIVRGVKLETLPALVGNFRFSDVQFTGNQDVQIMAGSGVTFIKSTFDVVNIHPSSSMGSPVMHAIFVDCKINKLYGGIKFSHKGYGTIECRGCRIGEIDFINNISGMRLEICNINFLRKNLRIMELFINNHTSIDKIEDSRLPYVKEINIDESVMGADSLKNRGNN